MQLDARQPGAPIVSLEGVTEPRRGAPRVDDDQTDPRTGLVGRATVLDHVQARLRRTPLTVVCCAVHDAIPADDRVAALGRLLASMAHPTDLVGRLDDAVLVVVCDGLTRPHTTKLVASLRAFEARVDGPISVGLASSRPDDHAAALLARADHARGESRWHQRGPYGPASR